MFEHLSERFASGVFCVFYLYPHCVEEKDVARVEGAAGRGNLRQRNAHIMKE